MKIRTQFNWLIAGILIMPIIMGAAILFLGYYYAQGQEKILIPEYREIATISGSEISEDDWKSISKNIRRWPRFVTHIVIDSSSTILYSTIPGYAVRQKISSDEIRSLLWNTDEKYRYQADSPENPTQTKFLVIRKLPRDERLRMDPFLWLVRWFLVVTLVIFVFSATMSSFIARSISRSVLILEEKTRRIAEGELDVEIDAKGSNEITSLTASLNRMRLALKEEQSRRSRFIMGVTHDLKTPLALIKGYTEAIADGIADDPESITKSLSIVGTKVDQLEDMIDDLIGFVKLDMGEWQQNLEKRELAPILRSFAHRMNEDADLLCRDFSSDINLPESVFVMLDERLLLRALENIANNAIRYTAEGGKIIMTAKPESRKDVLYCVITISDNGQGIAGDDLPHIFELFWRGSASRREEGMGLGLSVVKSVADSHGWKIDVKSEIGAGTKFSIIIPTTA